MARSTYSSPRLRRAGDLGIPGNRRVPCRDADRCIGHEKRHVGALQMFGATTNAQLFRIFPGFWIVYWQQYIALPLFLRGYVEPNAKIDLLLSVDPATVIAFQIVVSCRLRRMPAFRTMTLGILIASSWLILLLHASTGLVNPSSLFMRMAESSYRLAIMNMSPVWRRPASEAPAHGFCLPSGRHGLCDQAESWRNLVHYLGMSSSPPRDVVGGVRDRIRDSAADVDLNIVKPMCNFSILHWRIRTEVDLKKGTISKAFKLPPSQTLVGRLGGRRSPRPLQCLGFAQSVRTNPSRNSAVAASVQLSSPARVCFAPALRLLPLRGEPRAKDLCGPEGPLRSLFPTAEKFSDSGSANGT